MLPPHTKLIAILATVGLVLSGAVGVVGSDRGGNADVQPAVDQSDAESTCAATPPDDFADPPSDVIGWENGTWYDESIQVDQSDGLDQSEQDALVARTMARVEFVRCIEFDRGVPVSVIGREEYRERQQGRNVSPALRTFDNAKFEALFLVDENTDSIEVQQRNRGAAVLGFYSSERNEIVLIAEDRANLRIDEFTLAHELVHAWQDQTYNLSSEELRPRLRDEANARNGLVEGDARYVEHRYQRWCQEGAWNGTCAVPSDDRGGGELANIGVYLLKFQPYSDGPVLVRTVRTVGGWDAVDALYEQPPASTEQVIHVERYGTDAPEHPELEDRTTENWSRVGPPDRPNYASVGEAAVMSTFVYPYYDSQGEEQVLPPSEWLNFDKDGEVDDFDPLDYESNYSEGWDGDRLHVYQNETNATAYVWRLEWDAPQDAQEFVGGYRRVLDYWGAERVGDGTFRIAGGGFADAFHVAVEGTTVTIVNAPTVEQLDEVRTDLDVGSADAGTERRGTGPPGPVDRSGIVAVR